MCPQFYNSYICHGHQRALWHWRGVVSRCVVCARHDLHSKKPDPPTARWYWEQLIWPYRSVIAPWSKAIWLTLNLIRSGSQHAWHLPCLIECLISLAIPSCRKWAVRFTCEGGRWQDETRRLVCLNFFHNFLILNSLFRTDIAGQTLRTACKYVALEIWWGKVWQGNAGVLSVLSQTT